MISVTTNTLKNQVKEHFGNNINNVVNINLKNQDTQSDEIKSVQFSVFSSEEVLKYSVALINESKLSGEGSIYDTRLGVIQNYNKCVTCKGTNKECPGHFGHIELTYPIIHPLFVNQVMLYLNLFCSNCYRLCITDEEYNKTILNKYKNYTRTQKLSDYIQNKLKKCCHCNHKGYFYVHDENNIFNENEKKITSKQIKHIFDNLTTKEMKMIGCYQPSKNNEDDTPKNITYNITHPSNLILTVLPVLPLCARPFVETPNGICDDDLTNKYVEIVKVNNKLKLKQEKITNDLKQKNKDTSFDTDKEFLDILKHLEFHIKTLMDNSKGKARQINGRPIKCFRERLNGKTGLFRNNLSGKRVDFSARTVIGPDTTLKANEIAIPTYFAKKLTFPERVYLYNFNHLDNLIKENKVNYVIRDNGSKIYDIKIYKQSKIYIKTTGFTLQKGDIIIRNNKKIDPEKYKQIKGTDIVLEESDGVVRNGKLIKNIKISDELVLLNLNNSDRVLRNGCILNPNVNEFEFKQNDKLIRINEDSKISDKSQNTSKQYYDIVISPERHFQIKEGDIVERHLQNGDIVLFGRQPTLHKGSMIARHVKIIEENTSINNSQPIKTIRMNLAATKTYNADFDGDEMNIYVPQSYQTKCELEELSSTESMLKSGQASRLLLCICQDALLGGYMATRGEYRIINGKKTFFDRVKIDIDTFNDCLMKVEDWSMDYISNKITHIKNVLRWKNNLKNDEDIDIYNGHCLISMLFPDDFEYSFTPTNVKITNGVLISGILNKQTLSDSLSSIVHKLDKEYNAKVAVDFVSNFQFLINHFLIESGFSIGLQDCIVRNNGSNNENYKNKINSEMIKYFTEAQSIINTETDEYMKEQKINNCLNNATSVGQKISKETLDFDNSLNCMVLSGSKGSYVNIAQIVGIIGQQNVDGKRIPKNFGNRTLPHYFSNEDDYIKSSDNSYTETKLLEQLFESRGFVTSSYIKGLNPKQLFFHAAGGREGVIDTAIKTAKSGYIQRKLVKKMEDLKASYSGYIVNAKNNIIQFNYGDNFDPSTSVKVSNGTKSMSFINIQNIAKKLNEKYEFNNNLN
jgi:DNA-directed RNA polymerase beta' subunit